MFYFPHIPKAGGTTLLHIFYRVFGTGKCMKIWNPEFGADYDVEGYEQLSLDEICHYDAIIGHLPVARFFANPNVEALKEKEGITILTAVRDPIDRIISLYNYVSNYEVHPGYERVRKLDPVNYLKWQEPNFQFNFLSPDESTTTVDELSHHVQIIPMEKSIERFADILGEIRPVDLGTIEVRNRTADIAGEGRLFSREDLSRSDVEELTEIHSLDMELHRMALNNFETPRGTADRLS